MTRSILRLQVEKEALKKEKDKFSKERINEIDEKLKDLQAKEAKLRSDWEDEKRVNNLINKKRKKLRMLSVN